MIESATETGDAVARRLEWGQTLESLRAELTEDGLSGDIVDGLLDEQRPPSRRMWLLRAIVGTAVAGAGLVILPVAGVVGGIMAIPGTNPDQKVCGMYWIVELAMGLSSHRAVWSWGSFRPSCSPNSR